MAISESATGPNSIAVKGTAKGENSVGVSGNADTNGVQAEGGANGVFAKGKGWCGVIGISDSTSGGFGVFGSNSAGGTGVAGVSSGWMGIYGKSESTTGGAGVMGEAVGAGVIGVSKTWMGVYGKSESTTGGAGVMGESVGTGAAIYGKGGRVAGFFEGDVEVTGDIRLTNADCAEDFDICETEQIESGTVMVLGEEGVLYPSQRPYDKRVAGVISGAGDYKPGIVLDGRRSSSARKPLALLGKVYCKVDAQHGAIEVGDLLTTAPTPGHAMKADDPIKAFGAVIGKALRPLPEGQGLIPILIALQ
jgi:hypothetical protein